MVEFGLKLEDNKVSEWAQYYIDYEALKKILKNAKNAENKKNDMVKKNPPLAGRIIQAHANGEINYLTSLSSNEDFSRESSRALSGETVSANNSRHTNGAAGTAGGIQHSQSNIGLPTLYSERISPTQQQQVVTPKSPTTIHESSDLSIKSHDNIISSIKNNVNSHAEVPNEESPLLMNISVTPVSPASVSGGRGVDQQQEQNEGISSVRQDDSLMNTTKRQSSIHKTFSSISDQLSAFVTSHGNSGSRFERNLRAVLDDIDQQTKTFENEFRKEQTKVVMFYNNQLQELAERLDFVVETVAASFGTDNERHGSGEGGGDTEFDYDTQLALATRGANKKTVSPFPPTHRKKQRSMGQRVEEIINRLSVTSNSSIKAHQRRRLTNIHLGSLLQGDDEDFDLNYGDEDDDDDGGDKHSKKGRKMDKAEYQKRVAEADSIKRSLISQYRTSKLLQNYAIINITGFVKIAKKFDKTIPEEKGKFKECLESKNMLNDGKGVEKLAAKYETYFANWFCEGDLRAAKAQMLEKQGDGLEMDWSQLQLGYRMGMCAVLALWVCWDCVWGLVADGNSTIGARAAFPVFRACGGLLLLQWFWGISVFVWTRYRVNYIFLFDLVPKTVLTPFELFSQAVDNTIPFLTLMLLYYKSGSHNMPQWIPAGGYPLILVLLTILKLIFPLRQRMPMWGTIFKVVTAPSTSPNFFQTYVGDIFTSMVKIFQDIAWTICWTLSGDFLANEDKKIAFRHNWARSSWYAKILIPVLTQLPLVIRFNQCLRKYSDTGDRFPHVANAFKYALSQLVTLFGTFHPLYLEFNQEGTGVPFYQIFWTILFVSSSLYSFVWDVYMDWGLGRPKYGFLGTSLMYPHKYYYYCTIALDLVLRFMWVLTLVPPTSGASFAVPDYLNALTMMLELFRRTVWGFFRLENEHRSNVAGYRRIGFVPLHFNTGHKHAYEDKRETRGAVVLREVVLVALIVAGLCFGSIVAAQHANQHIEKVSHQEL